MFWIKRSPFLQPSIRPSVFLQPSFCVFAFPCSLLCGLQALMSREAVSQSDHFCIPSSAPAAFKFFHVLEADSIAVWTCPQLGDDSYFSDFRHRPGSHFPRGNCTLPRFSYRSVQNAAFVYTMSESHNRDRPVMPPLFPILLFFPSLFSFVEMTSLVMCSWFLGCVENSLTGRVRWRGRLLSLFFPSRRFSFSPVYLLIVMLMRLTLPFPSKATYFSVAYI